MRRQIITFGVFILIISFLLVGCTKYKLSITDLEWQPYLKGDILVFQSNMSEIDTVYITEINTYSNAEDHLAISSDHHETLFVSGLVTLARPKKDHLGNYYYKGGIKLLSMYADDDSHIEFELNKIGDSLRYASAKYTINEITKYYEESSKIDFNNIEDVVSMETSITYKIDYDLKNIWWSKEYGYVRYEYKNNYYWELKKFIRNGEDILK
ncbi:hypothetical protein IMCC3317_42620 [Kordia antarctica]|uniref:Lipoprotein n=1 Tax=Kordia antarctica TaxID=1218801 RepID=A0A7L4ZQI8_9FLAO|nr:hypothetical protein [Kordia antarctica]QHI38862.1 hypothetical protein IMCC3317_42620 [Kordia antarctica]